ncbi:MAG: DUF5659 domain-containing protein [Candidatus Omnitrophota bacterium]
MQVKNTYSTVDFYLASFLKARGLKIVNVKKENGRSVFIFEDIRERENCVRDYYNNGLIEVGKFKSALQDLKSIIHNL